MTVAVVGLLYLVIQYYTESSVIQSQDVQVTQKVKEDGEIDLQIATKNTGVYLTTEISSSDDYLIYEKRAFPWALPKERHINLRYQDKGDYFIRPNGTEVKKSSFSGVRLLYSNNEEKILNLE